MAEGPTTKLESVIAGIRGYIGGQLSELESELDSTRGALTALGEQLTARQTAIEALEASRALLLAKLNELDGAEAETRAFARARQSRKEAGGGPTATAKLTDSQRDVLNFLSTTPGVHKVSEIAVAVHGGDCDNTTLQAIRRALTVLTGAGLADKSTQSGTAFYSANAAAPAAAPAEAPAKKTAAKNPPAKKARQAAARPARKTAATEAASTKTNKVIDDRSTPVRARKATKRAVPTSTAAAEIAPAEKAVRADRTKIVAALLVASEPLSAGDVSRSVMGSQWKSSDATNFRNVLKNMLAEGVVAEHTDENNRARYTVAASN